MTLMYWSNLIFYCQNFPKNLYFYFFGANFFRLFTNQRLKFNKNCDFSYFRIKMDPKSIPQWSFKTDFKLKKRPIFALSKRNNRSMGFGYDIIHDFLSKYWHDM